MPKFTLVKQADHGRDTEVSMSFEVDSSDLAKEYFEDFLRASGFVLREPPESSGFMVSGDIADLEWDANGELKRKNTPVRLVE